MFKVSTQDARTDLYGIGKGAAQVLDLTPLREQAQLEEKERFAQQQAKAKTRADRQDKINEQIGALGSVAINPRDRELFAQKQKSVRDYVIQNSDALNNGDANAAMGFQNLYGNLMTEAEQSKNGREQWEQIGQQIAKDPSKYRPEAIEHYMDYMHPDHAGQYEFDTTPLKQNFDYSDHVTKDLFPHAKSVAGANEHGYSSSFNLKQANDLIADDLTDPVKFEQAHYDYEKSDDKLGAKTPLEYYQKRYAPKLVINSTKPLPEYLMNGDLHKNDTNITHEVNNDGGRINAVDPKTGIETNVDYDKDKNIIGGSMKRILTPEQKDINGKVQAFNDAKEKAYNAALEKAKLFRAKLIDPTQDDIDEYGGMLPKKNSDEYKSEPLPYSEDPIQLDATQAQEQMNGRHGIKAAKIINGESSPNTDIQYIDNRKKEDPKIADWNTKWNALPKGQKLVGPDGKTYTKQ